EGPPVWQTKQHAPPALPSAPKSALAAYSAPCGVVGATNFVLELRTPHLFWRGAANFDNVFLTPRAPVFVWHRKQLPAAHPLLQLHSLQPLGQQPLGLATD